MSKMTYTALALFLACSPIANAELVTPQPLSNELETGALASLILERSGTPSLSLSGLGLGSTVATTNYSSSLSNTTVKAVTQTKSEDDTVIVAQRTAISKKPVIAEPEEGLMDRMNELAAQTVRRFNQSGLASWYGRQFNGRPTASGERFDMHGLTAAHRSLPLNCYIRVTNQDNGKSVVVKVNDRGPFHGNRILDLSYGAAQQIGITSRGVGNVTIERIDPPNGK